MKFKVVAVASASRIVLQSAKNLQMLRDCVEDLSPEKDWSNVNEQPVNSLPDGGRQQNVRRPPRRRNDPRLMKGNEYPTHS